MESLPLNQCESVSKTFEVAETGVAAHKQPLLLRTNGNVFNSKCFNPVIILFGDIFVWCPGCRGRSSQEQRIKTWLAKAFLEPDLLLSALLLCNEPVYFSNVVRMKPGLSKALLHPPSPTIHCSYTSPSLISNNIKRKRRYNRIKTICNNISWMKRRTQRVGRVGYIVRFYWTERSPGLQTWRSRQWWGKHQGETSPHCKHTPSTRFPHSIFQSK